MNEEELPGFDELRRRAREAPGGVLEHLLAKIQARGEDDAVRDSPVAEDLRRLRAIFRDALRKKGLLIVALLIARLRSATSRSKARAYESAAVAQAAVAGNAFTAVLLAAVLATSISAASVVGTPLAGPSLNQAAFQATTTSRSSVAASPVVARSASRRDGAEFAVSSSSRSLRMHNSIGRRGKRLVVDSVVEVWMEPIAPRSDNQIWLECDSVRQTICSVAEPLVRAAPPPPES